MFIGQGLGYALRVGYFVLMARLLGVLEYGIVVGAFALVNLTANYSRLGTGMVLLRYVSADKRRFATYWGHVLVVTLVGSGLWIVLLHLVSPVVLGKGSRDIVILMAIGICVFEQLTISATQVFQAFQQMRSTAFLNFLTSLLRLLAAAVMLLVLHHATARQWAWASMIVSMVAAIIAVTMVTMTFGRPRFNLRLIRDRGVEGFEYAFASSTTSAYDDLDKTMLSHYGMNVANGIYTMAYRIIEMATMPIASIQLAAEPHLFELREHGIDRATEVGNRLLQRALLISLVVACVLFLVAPLVPLFVGESFAGGVSAVRWLCLIPLFRAVHYITGSTLTCIGLQRYRTINQVIAVLLNLGLNLWLIPRFSWHGAAWSSLVTDASLGLMNWTVLRWVTHKIISQTGDMPGLVTDMRS
jgi:O-antigen/teichoic acid export membrane protein